MNYAVGGNPETPFRAKDDGSGALQQHRQLLETCKMALAHCGWMEARGYAVPPLPNGLRLDELLRTALAKASEAEWIRLVSPDELHATVRTAPDPGASPFRVG